MSISPFVRRELISSVRKARAFEERRWAALLMATVVGSCFGLWDYVGWDRTSIGGSSRFALATFGLMVVGMSCLSGMFLAPEIGASIASERERKTLDALLSTRLGSVEIVLGTMTAALLRYANSLAATLPIVALMVFLGGVDWAWVVLAAVGLTSMTFLMAAAVVASSVGAKTARRAVNFASGMLFLGLGFPILYVSLRPIVWPGAPAWLTSIVIVLTDTSPMGLVLNLGGIAPRPGGPIGAVSRMVAWQVGAGIALTAWAIVRLRPASRGIYDVEGQTTRLRMLRAAMRRPPRRPPCGDDPVLWYEMYSTRGFGAAMRLVGRLYGAAWIVALGVGTWFFAAPAFAELAERGYGAAHEAFTMPELNPFARMLVNKLSKQAIGPTPGQARLEFSIMLRIVTCLFASGCAMSILSVIIERVKEEQRRDTWIGLIATPLTGEEILRAKGLGSIWLARGGLVVLFGLWTIGLLAGSVHPLGFLAAIGFLAVSCWFYAALGLATALREVDPERSKLESLSLRQLPAMLLGMFGLIIVTVALGWASLLTYEDVQAVIRSGPFPPFGESKLKGILGARAVVAACLATTSALAAGAFWLTRANVRGFDKAVGRPTRADAVTPGAA